MTEPTSSTVGLLLDLLLDARMQLRARDERITKLTAENARLIGETMSLSTRTARLRSALIPLANFGQGLLDSDTNAAGFISCSAIGVSARITRDDAITAARAMSADDDAIAAEEQS